MQLRKSTRLSCGGDCENPQTVTDADTQGFSLQKNPEPVFSESQDYHRVPVPVTPGAV